MPSNTGIFLRHSHEWRCGLYRHSHNGERWWRLAVGIRVSHWSDPATTALLLRPSLIAAAVAVAAVAVAAVSGSIASELSRGFVAGVGRLDRLLAVLAARSGAV